MRAPDGTARRTATVVNERGLHARAAARFVKLAARFQAEITVATRHHEVSAHSLMGLLMLAATVGTELSIAATGADAEAAASALADLVENGFEENDAAEP